MKTKNEVTISDDLLKAIDEIIGETSNRSQFIESILRKYFYEKENLEQDSKDLEILNRNSEYLNDEATDVLTYQVVL